MPWLTPTLKQVRSLVRDSIHGQLPGSDATVPNSVLRVMSDNQGALCFLTLEYVDWLALQLMVDTAETEWLDRHGNIWLVNADGSTGRKQATLATGAIEVSGTSGTTIPLFSLLGEGSVNATYQTTQMVVLGAGPTQVPTQALTAGVAGNMTSGDTLAFLDPPPGVDPSIPITVISMDGGVDIETDEELRTRILRRIRHPPAGGDADDYVQWTLAVPGVTRAWCSPGELGPGTVTVRFMMDDLRSASGGFPNGDDILTVQTYLAQVRPVAVKDLYVEAPIPFPVNFQISNLVTDDATTRQAIEDSVNAMILEKAAPASSLNGMPVAAVTIWEAWVSAAISEAVGVDYFDLTMNDAVMPNNGSMGVLGDITYA